TGGRSSTAKTMMMAVSCAPLNGPRPRRVFSLDMASLPVWSGDCARQPGEKPTGLPLLSECGNASLRRSAWCGTRWNRIAVSVRLARDVGVVRRDSARRASRRNDESRIEWEHGITDASRVDVDETEDAAHV